MSVLAPVQPRRRRRGIRRLLYNLSSVLILSGLLLLLDVAITLVWQEPLTAVIALVKHDQLDLRLTPLSSLDRQALASLRSVDQRLAYLARREQGQARTGEAIGRIVMPRIHMSIDVVQGTDTASLEKGPGHYPETALPGLGRTVAVAGHRTTYLAPFRHIDALRAGDTVVLEMPYGRFTYLVQYHRIVAPTALWVTHNVGYERLVLSACNPLYSAAQRIIVFARLRTVVPAAIASAPA